MKISLALPTGLRWRQNMGLDTLLYETSWDGSRYFHQGDGSYICFDRAPSADAHLQAGSLAFTGEAEVPASLVVHKDGTSTLTYEDSGIEWRFDEFGFPQEVVNPSGEGNTISLSYTESLLTQVTDTHGHRLTLKRDPTTTYATQIKDENGATWSYGYTGEFLTSYTEPNGLVTKYGYYEDGFLKDIVFGSDMTYVFTYDEAERLNSIHEVVNGTIEKVGSSDKVTHFTYEKGETLVKYPSETEETFSIEPSGRLMEEKGTQEEASESFAEVEGLESSTATADIGLQERAEPLDSQLYLQLKSKYVGIWFEPKSSHLTVGVAKGGAEEEVRQDIQRLGLEGQAKVIPESTEWGQLIAGQESLDSNLGTLEKEGLISTGINPSGNDVDIKEADSLTSTEKVQVKSEASKVGVPTSIKEEAVASLYGEADSCSHALCDQPWRGGISIQQNKFNETTKKEEPGVYCTAGFNARSLYDELPYVITAGHCLYDAEAEFYKEWYTAETGAREKVEGHEYYAYGDRQLGEGERFVYGKYHEGATSEGDAGAIFGNGLGFGYFAPDIVNWGHSEGYPIYNTSYNPNPRTSIFTVCTSGTPVLKQEGGLYNPISEFYPVPIDRCGVLLDSNVTAPYFEGATAKGLEEFVLCGNKSEAEGLSRGSSGSPVFRDHQAYGIISGGFGRDQCLGYYEGINNAEHALNVHLLTYLLLYHTLS
jgi:hypothetical protein